MYFEYIARLVGDQEARKASIESRGLSVVTTSGGLVSLLFGLVAVVTKAEGFDLPTATHGPLTAGLLLFVGAATCGLLVNKPSSDYLNVDVDAAMTEERLKERWSESATDVRLRVATNNVNSLREAQRVNELKGRFLFVAVLLELGAVIFVALAVGQILVSE